MENFGTKHKKVEKFVFRPKRLYGAKNRQISKTACPHAHAGKKKWLLKYRPFYRFRVVLLYATNLL